MIGGCRKQVSYALHEGLPEGYESVGNPTAHLGHAIHAYLLPRLADALGGQTEVEVTGAIGKVDVSGHIDLLTDTGVVDVKTVSGMYYPTVLRATPRTHLMQVTTYAMLTTRPHCLLLYVNRDTGDRFVVEWDTYEHAPDVEQWLTEAAAHPEVVDRDERGPG